MEVFIDKNNQPNIIKSEEFISRIYSALLKTNSNSNAEDIFDQSLKLLNKKCFRKTSYSNSLFDACIIRVLQYHELNSVVAFYINPNINDESVNILNLEYDEISELIWN